MSQDALSRVSLLVAIGLDNLHSNIAVRAFAFNSTNKHERILLIQEANATPNPKWNTTNEILKITNIKLRDINDLTSNQTAKMWDRCRSQEGRALARSLFMRRARRSRSQGAPRAPCSLSTINSQSSTIHFQLSTFNFQLFICHALPCFIAIARFGDGKGLFGQMMACGAYYTASETLAPPGRRCFRHYQLSIHNYQPSTINYQLSTINYQLFIVNY